MQVVLYPSGTVCSYFILLSRLYLHLGETVFPDCEEGGYAVFTVVEKDDPAVC